MDVAIRIVAESIPLPSVFQYGHHQLKIGMTGFEENPFMRTYLPLRPTIFASGLLLIPWILPGFSPAASQAKGETVSSVSAPGLEKIGDGSVEDPLIACLARVPSDANDSQRLLAVDSCKQEEVVRVLKRIDF